MTIGQACDTLNHTITVHRFVMNLQSYESAAKS